MTLPAYTGVLTPAHRQIITGIRDQWAAAVLSTAPVDRAAAVEAVRRLYETNKLRQPALTIWMDSPLGCIYAAAVVGQLGEQLRSRGRGLPAARDAAQPAIRLHRLASDASCATPPVRSAARAARRRVLRLRARARERHSRCADALGGQHVHLGAGHHHNPGPAPMARRGGRGDHRRSPPGEDHRHPHSAIRNQLLPARLGSPHRPADAGRSRSGTQVGYLGELWLMRQTAPRWQQVGRVRANARVQAGTSAAADALRIRGAGLRPLPLAVRLLRRNR